MVRGQKKRGCQRAMRDEGVATSESGFDVTKVTMLFESDFFAALACCRTCREVFFNLIL